MVVLLASDESRMVTGRVYPVDTGAAVTPKGPCKAARGCLLRPVPMPAQWPS
jgi:hypothetical protein